MIANQTAVAKPKPTHFKVSCFSLYTEDEERLDRLVTARKKREPKASKSSLVREALRLLEEHERRLLEQHEQGIHEARKGEAHA